jgi:hypothetical protein
MRTRSRRSARRAPASSFLGAFAARQKARKGRVPARRGQDGDRATTHGTPPVSEGRAILQAAHGGGNRAAIGGGRFVRADPQVERVMRGPAGGDGVAGPRPARRSACGHVRTRCRSKVVAAEAVVGVGMRGLARALLARAGGEALLLGLAREMVPGRGASSAGSGRRK